MAFILRAGKHYLDCVRGASKKRHASDRFMEHRVNDIQDSTRPPQFKSNVFKELFNEIEMSVNVELDKSTKVCFYGEQAPFIIRFIRSVFDKKLKLAIYNDELIASEIIYDKNEPHQDDPETIKCKLALRIDLYMYLHTENKSSNIIQGFVDVTSKLRMIHCEGNYGIRFNCAHETPMTIDDLNVQKNLYNVPKVQRDTICWYLQVKYLGNEFIFRVACRVTNSDFIMNIECEDTELDSNIQHVVCDALKTYYRMQSLKYKQIVPIVKNLWYLIDKDYFTTLQHELLLTMKLVDKFIVKNASKQSVHMHSSTEYVSTKLYTIENISTDIHDHNAFLAIERQQQRNAFRTSTTKSTTNYQPTTTPTKIESEEDKANNDTIENLTLEKNEPQQSISSSSQKSIVVGSQNNGDINNDDDNVSNKDIITQPQIIDDNVVINKEEPNNTTEEITTTLKLEPNVNNFPEFVIRLAKHHFLHN